jgi:hypothetical protein
MPAYWVLLLLLATLGMMSTSGSPTATFPGAELNGYGRFTVWGLTGLQLEYKLNNKVSVFGGPSLQYRLFTTGDNTDGDFYNLNFNLGMKFNLGKGGK